jgi:hypothetical protein
MPSSAAISPRGVRHTELLSIAIRPHARHRGSRLEVRCLSAPRGVEAFEKKAVDPDRKKYLRATISAV